MKIKGKKLICCILSLVLVFSMSLSTAMISFAEEPTIEYTINNEETEGVNNTEGTEGTEAVDGTEIPEGTEGAEGVDGTEVPEGTEGAEGVDGTEVPEGTEGAEGVDGTEVPEGTEGTEGVDGTEVPEGTESAEGVDGTEVPEGTESAEGVDGTENPEATEGTETPEVTDGTETPEVTEGTEPPELVEGEEEPEKTEGEVPAEKPELPVHEHSFTYSASGNSITAFCTEDCPDVYGDGITVTLNAPYDLTCDGEEKSAYVSGYPEEEIAGLSGKLQIKYYSVDEEGELHHIKAAPTERGDYVAVLTWGGETASVSYTVKQGMLLIDAKKNSDPANWPAFNPDPVFMQEAGVIVTLEADAGVFPEGSVLSVKSVPIVTQQKVSEAVESSRDNDQAVAVSYTFDICVLDSYGNELQPTDGAKVRVYFTMAEAADENLNTQVYHVTEDDESGELNAEVLENVVTDGETIVAETDGFSFYTVEFTYQKKQYVLPGGDSVLLSEVLDAVNLHGEVQNAKTSDNDLFTVDKNAAGIWIVYSLQPFTSTEWMKVTISDVEYEIVVTDNNGNVAKVGDEEFTGFDAALTAWTDGSTLRLLADVTTANTISVSGTKTLDLNGHGIKAASSGYSVITVENGADLTVIDSDPNATGGALRLSSVTGGYITGGSAGKGFGGGVTVNGGTLRLSGGAISGNANTYSNIGDCGGGVHVRNGGKFYMTGGEISGNTSYVGGGVCVDASDTTISITGGTIKNNQTVRFGSAVWAGRTNDSIFRIGGNAVIVDNISTWTSDKDGEGTLNSGSYLLSGNPTVHGYWKTSGTSSPNTHINLDNVGSSIQIIELEEALTNDSGNPNITLSPIYRWADLANGGTYVFTHNWGTYMGTADPADYFKVDDTVTGVRVIRKDGEAALTGSNDPGDLYVFFDANDGTGTMDPQLVTAENTPLNANAFASEDYAFGGWNTKADGTGTPYADKAEITISSDITLYAQWIDGVASVTVNSTTVQYDSFADAVSSWNSAESNATLTLHKDVETASVIDVKGTKTLDLNGFGIKMTGNNSVINVGSGVILTLKNSDNTTTHKFTLSDGAGLAVLDETSGNYTVNGGYITGGNNASDSAAYGGGGIHVDGTLNMTGGTIIGNCANQGGGVFAANGSRVTLEGTSIIGNTTKTPGGEGAGLYLYDTADVTLTDCTISRNLAAFNGGGAGHSGSSTLSISGNTVIKENYSGSTVNNVYISDAIIKVSGALGSNASIGVTRNGGTGVFTNSTTTVYNDASKFVSDNSSYTVAKNADGQLQIGDHYTVTYDGNGAAEETVPSDIVGYFSGDTVAVVSKGDLDRYGYRFDGWKIGSDDTVYANESDGISGAAVSFTITGDTTLTAQWTAIPKEGTPAAIFTAIGSNGGKLSDLMANKDYVVTGDAISAPGEYTSDSNGTITLSDIIAGILKLIKKGDDTTTIDSDEQSITVEKAATPDLSVTQPAAAGGQGVVATTTEYEYSSDNGTSWTGCAENQGLDAGKTYLIRVKATGAALASEPQSVTIMEYAGGTTSRVTGIVVDSSGAAQGGATVVLKRGSETIETTTTDAYGSFAFSVETGTYNIVVEQNGKEKTELIELTEDKTLKITMPDDVSSELDISGSGTPAVMVGNLDAEATSQAEAGHSVVVSMSVASETATNSAIAIALQDEAGELKTLDMLNISVSKSVDGAAATPIDETNNVIEIIVPYKFTGKEDIKVYRYHNNQAEALTEADTKADGTFRLDKTNGLIYIYTNKFSTYAIAFTQCYNINGTITYGSHSGSITLSLIDGNGSEIMNSNGDMNGGSYTLTHVPKGTYTMKATWTESGRECSIEKEINVK